MTQHALRALTCRARWLPPDTATCSIMQLGGQTLQTF